MASVGECLPKVAFLGPLGSHSYQCARAGFGANVEYIERPTITEVYNAVMPEVPFGLLPQENSVFGTVTETYDLLRLPAFGTEKFIRGELILSIRHALVVRNGVKLEDIERVLSHEQALGQCSRFLSENLPHAARVKTPSTSAAAQALLEDEDEDRSRKSAALCSTLCVSVFDGLAVLREDCQNANTNRTRFYVISHSLDGTLPTGFQTPIPKHALVRVSLKQLAPPELAPAPRNRLVHLVMSTLLTTFGLPTSRLDRRPSLSDTPFEDVYMVELEASSSLSELASSEEYSTTNRALWDRVKAGVARIEAAGGEATVLGVW